MRMHSRASRLQRVARRWRPLSLCPSTPLSRRWPPSPSPRASAGLWRCLGQRLHDGLCLLASHAASLLAHHYALPEQSCLLTPTTPVHLLTGLSRSDPDSPSKFAEALLGREFNSKVGTLRWVPSNLADNLNLGPTSQLCGRQPD